MTESKHILDLYDLLPAVYRIDDARQGCPLKALLECISRQVTLLHDDVAGLWNDFFIETCADWLIPYIGDLVANRPLHEVVRGRRADVAKTIYYRRRKGILPMLEELARDVTGWGSHAVAFFEQLGWTQHLNHLRMRPAPNPGSRNPNGMNRVSSIYLRDPDALDRLDGPFDEITHTLDVRRMDRTQGWYNLRRIGFFLWRLGSFRAAEIEPKRAVDHDYGYYFSPLGQPAPLFTKPWREEAESGLTEEIHIPGPIRPLALARDLADIRTLDAARGYVRLESASRFVGPERSIQIALGELETQERREVPPLDVVVADLRAWERPPAGFSGLFSGDLSGFAGLNAAQPEILVIVGGREPWKVVLVGSPPTLPDAAVSLQDALRRAAEDEPVLAGMRVIVVGTRLLILPGTRGAEFAFTSTVPDETTVSQLALDAASSKMARGVLSGDLFEFPRLSAPWPVVDVTIGYLGPRSVPLGANPLDLADARARLESALRAADGDQAFTAAQVLILENRLLVLPGTDGLTVVFHRNGADPVTAEQLRLTSKVAVDVQRGRLAFAIGAEPSKSLRVSCNYGFSAQMGGGSYNRNRKSARLGETESAEPDTVRDPNALGQLIQVHSVGVPTLSQALAKWHDEILSWSGPGEPRYVIQVEDSRTYEEDLTIELRRGELVLQAADGQRPTLRGGITVNAKGEECRLRVDGWWIVGALRVEGNLARLQIRHTTVVPGLGLDENGDSLCRDEPSLWVSPANTKLICELDHVISGPLWLPPETELFVRDSILDSPRRTAHAAFNTALISGDLTMFPELSSSAPTLLLTIGDEGPVPVVLPRVPGDLADARVLLETALHSAGSSPGFTAARVFAAAGGLILLSGAHEPIVAQNADDDPTASELRLIEPDARQVFALRSGSLDPFPALASTAPRLGIYTAADDFHAVELEAVPVDLLQAREVLEAALRAAGADQALADVRVLPDADRLLIVPGGDKVALSLVEDPNDPLTLHQLALDTPRPVLAASPCGEIPGPKATIERSTLLGRACVCELTLATETIFTERVWAQRRQAGCVRFCSIAAHSRTPRRFRCQPDLALTDVKDPTKREQLKTRMRPTFTSVEYGRPAYAQLDADCAEEIRTGAEDGSEMGAFQELMQPQRISNLQLRLAEYLPCGLDPGLVFVT